MEHPILIRIIIIIYFILCYTNIRVCVCVRVFSLHIFLHTNLYQYY